MFQNISPSWDRGSCGFIKQAARPSDAYLQMRLMVSLILHRNRFEVPDAVHVPCDADLSCIQQRGNHHLSEGRPLKRTAIISAVIYDSKPFQSVNSGAKGNTTHPWSATLDNLVISTRSFVIVSNLETCKLPSSFKRLRRPFGDVSTPGLQSFCGL